MSDSQPTPAISTDRLDALILPECREQIRREIADVGGAEVYFIARLDSALRIEEVEAYAFGNKRAVPALMQYARPGDIVIHNHPSGNLEPSDADIAVSSELGGQGIGSYIVNNDCSAVRVVVKAMKRPGLEPIDAEALANWLRPGGRIAESMDGYEDRPQQGQMLTAVAEAFNRDGLAVIEAGTGTGKSLAYLLPAIAWSLRNQEKVVVSTGTINLQEQLIEKDLPTILQSSGLKFEATLMKGRNNYLCLRKAEYLKNHAGFIVLGEKDEQLVEIQAWVKTTRDGGRDDLPFRPDEDVWESVASEGDNCLRTRCPHYQKCFFYNARRRAARANILVVNHHLMMADIAIRAETGNWSATAVLPSYHRVIVDEAHNLEPVATEYFGARAGRGALRYAMRRLMAPKTGDGLLNFLSNRIHEKLWPVTASEHDELLLKLMRELPVLHGEVVHAMDEATERLADALDRESNVPLNRPVEIKKRIEETNAPAWWEDEGDAPLRAVLTAARQYVEKLREVEKILSRFLEDATPEEATPILELQSAINKVESVAARLMRFIGDTDGHCRWIEYRRRPESRRGPEVTWCIAPLDVTASLRENVLRRHHTVVMTSATLTVERRFDYFLRQVGADDPFLLGVVGQNAMQPSAQVDQCGAGAPAGLSENDTGPAARPLRTMALDNPFDYDRQVYVGVPMDLPEPTAAEFEGALSGFLAPALEISRGRAMILFTAYSLLDRVHKRLAPQLEDLGYPCLRQGTASRTLLTESFRREIGSVLFATSSFWEGVDFQGEALSCLVLTRLPFGVPGEPLVEARIEELRRKGLDPFYHMIVPQAVIRFRQGFGRLIRHRGDRGVVLICDRRVNTRHYGRMFLRSLPTQNIHCVGGDEVLHSMRSFFDADGLEY
ncbi:MAG: helicase C-terminal domain-containing protein [Candidatus Sumerlaeia bacterium]